MVGGGTVERGCWSWHGWCAYVYSTKSMGGLWESVSQTFWRYEYGYTVLSTVSEGIISPPQQQILSSVFT